MNPARQTALEKIAARQGRTINRIVEVCKLSERFSGDYATLAKAIMQIIAEDRARPESAGRPNDVQE